MQISDVNIKYPSCPSFVYPFLGDHFIKKAVLENLHRCISEVDQETSVNKDYTNIHSRNEIIGELFNHLKSQSSQELEELLNPKTSITNDVHKVAPNAVNFWQQFLFEQLFNYNVSVASFKNKSCMCKPVKKTSFTNVIYGTDTSDLLYKSNKNSIRETPVQTENILVNSTNTQISSKNKACMCTPVKRKEKSKTDSNREKQKKFSAETKMSNSTETIKFCLPFDLEQIQKDSFADRKLELIICDKKHPKQTNRKNLNQQTENVLAGNKSTNTEGIELYLPFDMQRNQQSSSGKLKLIISGKVSNCTCEATTNTKDTKVQKQQIHNSRSAQTVKVEPKRKRRDFTNESTSNSIQEIKLCLPFDFDEESSPSAKFKLVICANKSGNTEDIEGEKSTSESKEQNTNGENRLSVFPKKCRDPQGVCTFNKCVQTCGGDKMDSTVGTSEDLENLSLCLCPNCGKVDPEKSGVCKETCKCCLNNNQADTLKLMMKMEAKHNYRQTNNILKELQEQKIEILRLNKEYQDLLKTVHINGNKQKTETTGTSDTEICNDDNYPQKGNTNKTKLKDTLNTSKYAQYHDDDSVTVKVELDNKNKNHTYFVDQNVGSVSSLPTQDHKVLKENENRQVLHEKQDLPKNEQDICKCCPHCQKSVSLQPNAHTPNWSKKSSTSVLGKNETSDGNYCKEAVTLNLKKCTLHTKSLASRCKKSLCNIVGTKETNNDDDYQKANPYNLEKCTSATRSLARKCKKSLSKLIQRKSKECYAKSRSGLSLAWQKIMNYLKNYFKEKKTQEVQTTTNL